MRAALAHLWILILLGAMACDADQTQIQVESIKLATGEYYGLAWGGTQVERFHVLAHRGSRDGEVVLLSPGHDAPCSLGKLARYLPLTPDGSGSLVINPPSPARIPIWDLPDDNGHSRLSFTDVDCKRTPLTIDAVSTNALFFLNTPALASQLALITDDQDLLLVDPRKNRKVLVAQHVEDIFPLTDSAWLIESGEAVRRDLDGKVTARMGHAVSELVTLDVAGEDIAIVDKAGLSIRHNGRLTTVDADACKVKTVSDFLPAAIAYYSPCADKQLVIRTVDGRTFELPSPMATWTTRDNRLIYTVDAPDGENTEVWLISATDPERAVKLGQAPLFHADRIWRRPDGRYWMTAKAASGIFSLLLLDADIDSPALRIVEGDIDSITSYVDRVAVLKRNGTLQVRRISDMGVIYRAQNVRASGLRFAFTTPELAMAYVAGELDATGPGTLHLDFLSGQRFVLAKNVREFREVWWPERGFLYATTGPDAGIYFARVDIPCELTTDAPWACGF